MGENFDDYTGFQQIPGMPILLQQSVPTVQSRVEARVTIQEIKSLVVLQTETCH